MAAAVVLAACSDPAAKPALFPADYASTYTQVRTCRSSVSHGTVNVRVLSAPDALQVYKTRTGTFATGAILLKEEYDEADTSCSGPIKAWTAMEKLDDGSSPKTLDWHWQKTDAKRHVIEDDNSACINCHGGQECAAPVGYLYTCTMPP